MSILRMEEGLKYMFKSAKAFFYLSIYLAKVHILFTVYDNHTKAKDLCAQLDATPFACSLL